MAGSKFQYDESGGTFYYFLLSFLALVLIPATYYLWPKDEKKSQSDRNKQECNCNRCEVKQRYMRQKEPWRKTKRTIIKTLILLGWVLLAMIAYKCAHIEHDAVHWDPFEILEIDPSASAAEIKKAYRRLSLIFHPDKETGDEYKFMQITKAYAALTDEEARKNWELYGTPDGPGATSFGIALPEWIVKKENSFIVLGIYALIFMIALPTAVGIWWYKSIKFGGDSVLLDTTQLYYYFIHRSPSMMMKRVIMIIAASMEFEPGHNSEIVMRMSDDQEVVHLIKQLRYNNLGEKNKERPLCYPYSLKSRALLHAHLSRMELPEKTLELDRLYIVKKCPYLIHEFVQCTAQLTMLYLAGRMSRSPALETLENAMKLCPMIVQAMWENKSPLLQLPHFDEELIRRISFNKRNTFRSIRDLARMGEEDRRKALQFLAPYQIDDVVNVISKMPILDVSVRTQVIDDEDPETITAGAIVTVFVTLSRKPMEILFGKQHKQPQHIDEDGENVPPRTAGKKNQAQGNQKPVWRKPQKPHKGGNKGKGKGWANQSQQILQEAKKLEQQLRADQAKNPAPNKAEEKEPEKDPSDHHVSDTEEKTTDAESVTTQDATPDVPPRRKKGKDPEESASESETESESSKSEGSDSDEDSEDEVREATKTLNENQGEDDDDDWDAYQDKIMKKKDKVLEGRSKISHSVHCPYFPEDKQEYWWVYMKDTKKRALLTMPLLVTDLKEQEEVELKFTAPAKPGQYQYTVMVKSDSYLDCDKAACLRIDVQPAKKVVESHPQWEMSEDEEEINPDEDSAVEDSDLLDDSDRGRDSDSD